MISGSVQSGTWTSLVGRTRIPVFMGSSGFDIDVLLRSTEGSAIDRSRITLVLAEGKVRNLALHVAHEGHGACGPVCDSGRCQKNGNGKLHLLEPGSDNSSKVDVKVEQSKSAIMSIYISLLWLPGGEEARSAGICCSYPLSRPSNNKKKHPHHKIGGCS
jgi:hypothetical protein